VTGRVSRIAVALVACAALLCLAAAAEACPTCKDSLAGDPIQEGMVRGYFYSILFMMSMPFVILGSFGGYAYFTVRRARRARQGAAAPLASALSAAD
jgi:hypothetical protein